MPPLKGLHHPGVVIAKKCGLLPEISVITWTYWFCCTRTSLERTLLMVTRFVSVPEYPANANPLQNEAALVGAWLKTGYRDGKNKNQTQILIP